MNSERWKKISIIFKTALEIQPRERIDFLKKACGTDSDLFGEVKSLLLSHEESDSLEKNAFEVVAEQGFQNSSGRKISVYEVIRLIGIGGMGEVYLAEDTRLERKVALKLLGLQFTSQKELVERFQQEAKATSNLNHPNILTVHDFGESNGRPYFVTEFVQGETLRMRLLKENLTLGQKLDIAIQIARGLNAAHEAGIIHRDIKPENIMIRDDGYVKILDFGLAKLIKKTDFQQFQSTSGVILGTVSYMSPEQASGLKLDQRTDIWSLGVVLYEMLTGKTPFDDETPSAILASILKSEPPNVEIKELNQIIRKALQKNTAHRYQSVKEILKDLNLLDFSTNQAATEILSDASILLKNTGSFKETVPNNLTYPPTIFVGRNQEIKTIKKLFDDENARLITLTGAGGTGKTRLALQVASELLSNFEDGVYFIRLISVFNPDLAASTIAQTLEIKEAGNSSITERLKEFLRNRKILLILDNFEQILPASSLITELLSFCPQLKILITSRAVLRVRGEYEFFVPTLNLPEEFTSLKELNEFSGIKLFVQLARTVKSDFELTDENAAAVTEICQKLDGLPLALELAAARLKLFSPQVLAKKLNLKILTGGAKDLPEKQQTMRDAIVWSYQLLSETEKKVFRSLAVFAGGFTLESFENICHSENLLDEIASLVDKSLLRQRELPNAESRFFMLMTLKEFGLEELSLNNEQKEICFKHLQYFSRLAKEHSAKLRGVQTALSVDVLEEEHSNLRLALDFAIENDLEKAALLAVSLSQFWILRNYYAEGFNYLETIAKLSENQTTKVRAEILRGAGTILRMQGKFNESRSFFKDSLTIGKDLRNPETISFSLDGLAIAEINEKNYQKAQMLLEESLKMAKLTDDEQKTVNPLNLLGETARIQSKNETALFFYQAAYQVLQKTDINPSTAVVLNNLGYVNDELGNYQESLDFQKKCLEVCLQLKNRRVAVTSIDGLASLAAKLQDFERAAKLLGTGFQLRKTLGFTKTPTDMPLLERAVNLTKNALGEEKYQQIFEDGEKLNFDEAIDFAVNS